MKALKSLIWLSLFIIFAAVSIKAQNKAQVLPPPKYRMELIYIFEDKSTEFLFAIGSVGFKSVASLKKFVSQMPPGSVLEWAPGCLRVGNEPLLSSEKELADFKAFCDEKKIKFVLIPSG
jgi:hypothetical protein